MRTNIRDYIENRRLDDLALHAMADRLLTEPQTEGTRVIASDRDLKDIFIGFPTRAPGLTDLARFAVRVANAEAGGDLSFVRDGSGQPRISLYHPIFNAPYHADNGLALDPNIRTAEEFAAAVVAFEARPEDDVLGM